jgi:hypothetical protein
MHRRGDERQLGYSLEGRDPSVSKHLILNSFFDSCPTPGCSLGPGLRRDGVICGEAATNTNRITLDSRGQRPESVFLKSDML